MEYGLFIPAHLICARKCKLDLIWIQRLDTSLKFELNWIEKSYRYSGMHLASSCHVFEIQQNKEIKHEIICNNPMGLSKVL